MLEITKNIGTCACTEGCLFEVIKNGSLVSFGPLGIDARAKPSTAAPKTLTCPNRLAGDWAR